MTDTEMPETVWINIVETDIDEYRAVHGYAHRCPKGTQYLLKSIVDAERAELRKELSAIERCYALEQDWRIKLKIEAKADSKTIRALAEALGKVDKKLNKFDIKASDFRIGKPCLLVSGAHKIVQKALSDNAPRIKEAQEGVCSQSFP